MNCQEDIKKKFHKLRPTNKIKNAWYSERRKSINKNKKNKADPSTQITIPSFVSFVDNIRNLAQSGTTNDFTSTTLQLTTLKPSFQPVFKQPDRMKPDF